MRRVQTMSLRKFRVKEYVHMQDVAALMGQGVEVCEL